MATYTFNFDAAKQTADNINGITQRIQQVLADLETEAARSLSSWSGQARHAYQQERDKWARASQRMPQSLAAARAVIERVDATYKGAETRGQNAWG